MHSAYDLRLRAAPGCSAFNISSGEVYFGLAVGPGADDMRQWVPALSRHDARAGQNSHVGLAPSLTTRLHTSRVAHMLQYAAQFAQQPRDLVARRSTVTERLGHAPHMSLPQGAIEPLKAI